MKKTLNASNTPILARNAEMTTVFVGFALYL